MAFNRLTSILAYAGAATLILAVVACSPGSTSVNLGGADCTHPTATDINGCVYVTLSDAPGDFLTYTVNVTKLQLTRADGTTVSELSNSTTVDFAQYQDLSEFLTLNSTPPGTYVSGVITLDYTNADIETEDSTGNAVKLTPVDEAGNPVTSLDLTINLDPAHPLVLIPGVPRLFNVDFDLDASNIVNSNGTVTVEPLLFATVDPATGEEQRVRGPLDSVDTAKGSFTLGLRPFEALTGDYGKFAIYTNASTSYIINQQAYVGGSGLAALQAAGATTAVVVQGRFDFSTFHLVADSVLAGSSVPGGTMDTVQGVVTSRSGDTLTLRGTTLYRAGQDVIYRDTVTATLGTNTKVREVQRPLIPLDISAISVGQRLLLFGTLTNTDPSSLQLDASNGFALLEFTKVDGNVVGVSSSSLTMDVNTFEGRKVSLFNFTGTGSDPLNYNVAFTNDIGSGIAIGDPLRATGFVAPFGSAPPDFNAHTLVDYVHADALISLAWAEPGTTGAFNILDASGIVPNLASSPILHRLRQGGIVTDLYALPSIPTIKGSLIGLYAVLRNGNVQVYLGLQNFIDSVQAQLSGGAKVRGFYALGGFDDSTDVLDAKVIAIVLN